jgi:hypothetical protein
MRLILNGSDIAATWEPAEMARTSIVTRAWQGEPGVGSIVAPDVAGTAEWYAGQQCKITDGPTTLIDGYLGGEHLDRGGRVPPERLHAWQVSDRNARFQGDYLWRYRRPIETDRARVLAFAAALLPDLTTTWVLNESTRNMAAKVYNTDDPWNELLIDIGDRIQKTLFIDGGDLHYHLPTSGAESLFRIQDTLTGGYAAAAGAFAAEEVDARAGIYTNGPLIAQAGMLALDGGTSAAFAPASSQWAEVADSSQFDATNQLFLIAIAKWTVGTGIHTMIRRGSGGNEWWLRTDTVGSPLVEFGLTTGALTQLRHTGWNDGIAHLVIATYDGTTMRLYIDGTERNNVGKTGNINLVADGRIGIGAAPAPGEYWDGNLQEVAMGTGVPAAATVTRLYEIFKGLRGGDFRAEVMALSGLKAYWRLGDQYRFVPQAPSRDKDAIDLRNRIRAHNSAGRWKIASDTTSIARHNAGGLKHVGLVDAGDLRYDRLDEFAARVLQQSKDERKTYDFRFGPIPASAVGYLRAGQRQRITSQAVGLSDSLARIAELELVPTLSDDGNPIPGMWDALVQNEYPRRRPPRRKWHGRDRNR